MRRGSSVSQQSPYSGASVLYPPFAHPSHSHASNGSGDATNLLRDLAGQGNCRDVYHYDLLYIWLRDFCGDRYSANRVTEDGREWYGIDVYESLLEVHLLARSLPTSLQTRVVQTCQELLKRLTGIEETLNLQSRSNPCILAAILWPQILRGLVGVALVPPRLQSDHPRPERQ